MRGFNSLVQVNQLIDNTYVLAFVVVGVAVCLAMLVATLIAWQGTPDKSYIKRRIWYGIILFVSAFGFWIYNFLYIAPQIQNIGWRNMFEACNNKCLGITIVVNIIVGVILMCFFRKSKFASILFSIKRK